jgi:hypothetical protein
MSRVVLRVLLYWATKRVSCLAIGVTPLARAEPYRRNFELAISNMEQRSPELLQTQNTAPGRN